MAEIYVSAKDGVKDTRNGFGWSYILALLGHTQLQYRTHTRAICVILCCQPGHSSQLEYCTPPTFVLSVPFNQSTKMEALMEEVHLMQERDPAAKAIVFSQVRSSAAAV